MRRNGKNGHTEKARERCRKKFLRFFRGGFSSEKYEAWERGYKWNAHLEWKKQLGQKEFEKLLAEGKYTEIAARAVKIETRTNLLFSFEKMALRDAVRGKEGAKIFAEALYYYIYGSLDMEARFERFSEALALLPQKQTRVRTWPLQTVFGFIANPKAHIFLKPRVTQAAADAYEYDFEYQSRPNWQTYHNLLDFAAQIRKDLADLRPRDMIDVQSFIWVMGSDEYA